MPRVADERLEERILAAARRLWREQGEKGLTLRAVARAAKTTTPTVYKRFRNKEAILMALALRLRDELNADLFQSSSVEEIYRRYLAHAEANPHQYDLFRLTWTELYAPDRPRPGRVWAMSQMAARFGGRPEDYGEIIDTVFLLCHGTASLLIHPARDSAAHDAMRQTCIRACDRIVQHIEIFRSGD
jgi:AcrR family transcriptional regulator